MTQPKNRFDVQVVFPDIAFGIRDRKDVTLTPENGGSSRQTRHSRKSGSGVGCFCRKDSRRLEALFGSRRPRVFQRFHSFHATFQSFHSFHATFHTFQSMRCRVALMHSASRIAEIDDVTDVLLSGDVARALNVSAETVRFWERIGRLPAMRTERGVRLFSRRDVEALKATRDARRASAHPSVGLGPLTPLVPVAADR